MKVCELEAICGKAVDVGCVDVRAETTELGVTGVVEKDDEDVGRPGGVGCGGSMKCGTESASVRPIIADSLGTGSSLISSSLIASLPIASLPAKLLPAISLPVTPTN